MKSKKPKDSLVVSRKIVMPEEINPHGTLFGGVLMSWMDKAALMSSQIHAGHPTVVTVNIDNIQFLVPVRIGEHVIIHSWVEYVGRTSMEVKVVVERECMVSLQRERAATASMTFVSLDSSGDPRPVPQLELDTEEARAHHYLAKVRVKVRERMRTWFRRAYTNLLPRELSLT